MRLPLAIVDAAASRSLVRVTVALFGRRNAPAASIPDRPADISPPTAADGPRPELIGLMYELLDAHADTVELAGELAWDANVRWRVHVDYLRSLQRSGRATLARASWEGAL